MRFAIVDGGELAGMVSLTGTAVANVASQRVLERNAFTLVGTLRKHLLLHGVWTDHLLWERLADD